MSEEPKLTPAKPDEVAQTLAFALRYNGRKRTDQAAEMMAQITAAHLIAHLERSGFVVMQKPAAPLHSAPCPYAPPLKD